MEKSPQRQAQTEGLELETHWRNSMADKVKHWPSWANWYARDSDGRMAFYENEPIGNGPFPAWYSDCSGRCVIDPKLELVEIDPNTPWQESKQRRPE